MRDDEVMGKKVAFDKVVQARWRNAIGEPEKIKEARVVTMLLTNDKKRTVGNFKSKRAVGKARREDVENGDGDELGVEEGVIFEDGFAPMPL